MISLDRANRRWLPGGTVISADLGIKLENVTLSILGQTNTLADGVPIIRVGVSTEVEPKERKDRVDEGLHATCVAP